MSDEGAKGSVGGSPPGTSASASSKTLANKSRVKTRIRLPGKEECLPKHSQATEMKFRVMRQCLERLRSESKDIKVIRSLLQKAMKDVAKELEVVRRMRELAMQARLFQFGNDVEFGLEGDFQLPDISNITGELEDLGPDVFQVDMVQGLVDFVPPVSLMSMDDLDE